MSDPKPQSYAMTKIDGRGVATVTLSAPKKRNSFDGDGIRSLTETFMELANDNAVKVVHLRGEGKVFCAGMDLKYAAKMGTALPEANKEGGMALAEMFGAVLKLGQDKPLIVEVHGGAYGGAVGFLGAGYVIAEPEAKISTTEVTLGLAAMTVACPILYKIGPENMEPLAVTGIVYKADSKEIEHSKLVNITSSNKDALPGLVQVKIEDALQNTAAYLNTGFQGDISPEPSDEMLDNLVSIYRKKNPAAAPNAAKAGIRAVWDIHAMMGKAEAGENPYTEEIALYAMKGIAKLREDEEFKQHTEFANKVGAIKDKHGKEGQDAARAEIKELTGSDNDPREWPKLAA